MRHAFLRRARFPFRHVGRPRDVRPGLYAFHPGVTAYGSGQVRPSRVSGTVRTSFSGRSGIAAIAAVTMTNAASR